MKLRQARTSTFIAVVFAENVRAYTSRSFDRPFYQDILSNAAMQKVLYRERETLTNNAAFSFLLIRAVYRVIARPSDISKY